MKKTTKDSITVYGGLVSSVCALIVTLIAIWAAFFTSLSEKLLEQYQSDIALAKSELVDLRNEKRDILNQNSSLTSNIESLKNQNVILADENKELFKDREKLTGLELDLKRKLTLKIYRNRSKLHIDLFNSLIRNLEEYRRRSSILVLLPEFEKWLKHKPIYPEYNGPKINEEEFEKGVSDYNLMLKEYSSKAEEWRSMDPLRKYIQWSDLLNGEFHYSFQDDPKAAMRVYHKYILSKNAVQSRISLDDLIKQLVDERFDANKLDLSNQIIKEFRNNTMKFINENGETSRTYLNYLLEAPLNRNEIIQTGKKLILSIDKAEILVNKLALYLEDEIK